MGWVVSVTPRPRFTPSERTPGTHCTGGWVGLRASLDTEARGKNHYLCRGSKSGRPVCSQTLILDPVHVEWYLYRLDQRVLGQELESKAQYTIFVTLRATMVQNKYWLIFREEDGRGPCMAAPLGSRGRGGPPPPRYPPPLLSEEVTLISPNSHGPFRLRSPKGLAPAKATPPYLQCV
jgi:hypothetical protein